MRSSCLTGFISRVDNNKQLLFFCKANLVKSNKCIFMFMCACVQNVFEKQCLHSILL